VWDFDPLAVPPGEVRRVQWAYALNADGSIASIPLIVIAGSAAAPGKVAALTGGVHGDEFEGPHALWQLATALDPSMVSGHLLIVPVVHRAAYAAGLRVSPIDGVNLARVFPGDPNGTVTQRLAFHVFDKVVSRASLLIDCHSGGVRMAFLPVAGFYAEGHGVSPEAARLSLTAARWMGLPHLWELPPRSGVLSFEAARLGIAVTGCEIGGRGGRLDADSALYRDGIWRVLQAHGFLTGDPGPESHYDTYLNGDWELANAGGTLENFVDLGQRVTSGTEIALIRGVFGEPVEKRTATTDGIVMGVRHLCSINAGEWATCIVEEKPFL
jgi:N-alpha-acetyl-L-2,4-diaminobutyrate deacetylase